MELARRKAERNNQGRITKAKSTIARGLAALGTAAIMSCSFTSISHGVRGLPPATEQGSAIAGYEVNGKEVSIDRVLVDGKSYVRARLSDNPSFSLSDITYNLFLFQQPESGGPEYLYNTRHDPADKESPAFVGLYMRDVTLSNGERGDFVVRVKGRKPITGKDGRIDPDDVLLEFEQGYFEIKNAKWADKDLQNATELRNGDHLYPEYGVCTGVILLGGS